MVDVIGWLVGLAVAVIAAWATLRARRRYKSKLEIVGAESVRPSSAPASPRISPSDALGVSRLEFEVSDDPVDSRLATDPPVLDVKLHNRGGESVVIKEMGIEVSWAKRFDIPELSVYRDFSGGVIMPVTATYEVKLPDPDTFSGNGPISRSLTAAAPFGEPVRLGISHVVAPDQTDRIQVLLRADYPSSETQVYMMPGASVLYLLRLRLVYGADSKNLATRTIAVACPGNRLYVPEAAALRRRIERFEGELVECRGRLEQEMQGDRHLRDRLPIDWTSSPPRRSDLPEAVGNVRLTQLHDSFWDPQQAIETYLRTAESVCRDMAALPSDLPDGVAEIGAHARSALRGIVALREQRAG